jgi:hypothetical protein
LEIDERIDKYHQIVDNSMVDPKFFSPAYLAYRISTERLVSFHQQRLKWIHSELNHDFNLKGYLYHYRLWGPVADTLFVQSFNYLEQNRWLLSILILSFFMILHSVATCKKQRFYLWKLMLVGGYSIALEIIFILEYQILYGTVYSSMTIIFGLFMLGLAVGVKGIKAMKNKFPEIQLEKYLIAGFLILDLILLIPASLLPVHGFMVFLSAFLKWGLALLLIFMNGYLTGGYFSLITSHFYKLSPSSSAGITYGFDLAGSVMAAFMVSIFLVPIFEIRGVLFILLFFMTVQLVWRGK